MEGWEMCIWLDWHEIKQLKLNQDDKNSPDQTQNSAYTHLLQNMMFKYLLFKERMKGMARFTPCLGKARF